MNESLNYTAHPRAAARRHFWALLIGALPAIYLGFRAGLFAAGAGSHHALAFIFLRAAICAAPIAVLALLAPRAWLLPSLIFGFGFYFGYDLFDIARGLNALFAAQQSTVLIAAFTGEPLWAATPTSRPELPWILLLAFWAAAFIAFLRRHYSRPNESA